MNLARFGLTKNSAGEIVEDGFMELVEVPEHEALQSSAKTYKFDLLEELVDLAESLGVPRLGSSLRLLGQTLLSSEVDTPVAPRRKRRYVKHEKKTSQQFVSDMCAKYGLLDLKKSILHMKPAEILGHFPRPQNPKEVDKNLFARNVIWEFYRSVQAGKPPEFVVHGCNMRTIFYYLKPTFTDMKAFANIDSIYGNFTESYKTLVLAGLISYKDLNIMDDRKVFRVLAPSYGNNNILLLAEKKAYVGRFFAYASRYGVSAQITTGRSTITMTDTILTEMFENGYDMNQNLSVLSFCDFDPVGTSIPYHFCKHLNKLGFHNINEFTQYGDATMRRKDGDRKNNKGDPIYITIRQQRPALDIVNPHDLDADTRRRLRHRLSASIRDNPTTKDWAFITGGVTGTGRNTEYAISAEQFLPYLDDHLEQKIQPLLGRPPESFGRLINYKNLRKAIREYIGARAELGAIEPLK